MNQDKKKSKNKSSRGKASAVSNFFLLSASIIGLAVYFTVQSLWSAGTAAVIIFLLFPAAFYFWLWRCFK